MKQATEELERVKELLRAIDAKAYYAGDNVVDTLALLRSAQRHLEVAIGILNRNK